MKLKPDPTHRTFERVADHLRDMLTSGELMPGDRLPSERKLSLELKVSRSALREALRTLEFEGILELKQGKTGGAFVSPGNLHAISDRMSSLLRMGNLSWNELAEVRIWLEEIIIRVSCQRATRADIRALQDNISAAQAHFKRGEMKEKTDVNIEFHNLLAQTTRNPFLTMIVQTISGILRYFTPRLSVKRTREVFRSRRRFMAAFIAHDADTAVKEMERNLKMVHRFYVGPPRIPQKKAKSKNVNVPAQHRGSSTRRPDSTAAPRPRK